jgi:hypothetical protein
MYRRTEFAARKRTGAGEPGRAAACQTPAMPGPSRRRVDLRRLPAAQRYLIAVVLALAVVAVVLLVRRGRGWSEPVTWYAVAVRIGAIALLGYGVVRLLWWIAHRRRAR